MHDIRFFADIQCADTFQLLWPIANADIYTHIFLPPDCRKHQGSPYYYVYSYCDGALADAAKLTKLGKTQNSKIHPT